MVSVSIELVVLRFACLGFAVNQFQRGIGKTAEPGRLEALLSPASCVCLPNNAGDAARPLNVTYPLFITFNCAEIFKISTVPRGRTLGAGTMLYTSSLVLAAVVVAVVQASMHARYARQQIVGSPCLQSVECSSGELRPDNQATRLQARACTATVNGAATACPRIRLAMDSASEVQ